MNNDLMKAILALDAYNRGYNEGIIISETVVSESLGNLRSGQATSVEELALAGSEGGVAGIGSGITGGGLHSMASLVMVNP